MTTHSRTRIAVSGPRAPSPSPAFPPFCDGYYFARTSDPIRHFTHQHAGSTVDEPTCSVFVAIQRVTCTTLTSGGLTVAARPPQRDPLRLVTSSRDPVSGTPCTFMTQSPSSAKTRAPPRWRPPLAVVGKSTCDEMCSAMTGVDHGRAWPSHGHQGGPSGFCGQPHHVPPSGHRSLLCGLRHSESWPSMTRARMALALPLPVALQCAQDCSAPWVHFAWRSWRSRWLGSQVLSTPSRQSALSFPVFAPARRVLLPCPRIPWTPPAPSAPPHCQRLAPGGSRAPAAHPQTGETLQVARDPASSSPPILHARGCDDTSADDQHNTSTSLLLLCACALVADSRRLTSYRTPWRPSSPWTSSPLHSRTVLPLIRRPC